MPLASKPYRFPTPNRRLTEREIDERERALEWEKRHRDCEDDPCDDCRREGNFCAEDDCPDPAEPDDYLCRKHRAEENRDRLERYYDDVTHSIVRVASGGRVP